MKKILFILSLLSVTSLFANTASVYRFDDVHAIIANGKTILIEDVRDGFVKISGVVVTEEFIAIQNESEALILFRNTEPNHRFGNTVMAIKIGGDGGGG